MKTEGIRLSLADVLDSDRCPELLGANPCPRVVGVAVNDNEVYIWQRRAADEVESGSQPVQLKREKFRPYLWLHYSKFYDALAHSEVDNYESQKLSGTGFFNSIVSANDNEELVALNKMFTSLYKEVRLESAHLPLAEHSALQLYSSDLVNLYLTQA